MKTTIGGDRLGSGSKQNISLRKYERSTHDLSYLWRSSMSAGTLVPFMSQLALPGDSWDINLQCEVLTLPTIGPLFGSYKIQLDVFQIPVRLYNAGLHMNRLGIGMDMSEVYLPKVQVLTNNHTDYEQTFKDNEQINPSSLLKYLGISGLGNITGTTDPAKRFFNAVPLLAYWDIYKNYYANKQEEVGYVIHTIDLKTSAIQSAVLKNGAVFVANILTNVTANVSTVDTNLVISFTSTSLEPDPADITVKIVTTQEVLGDVFDSIIWNDSVKTLYCTIYTGVMSSSNWEVTAQTPEALGGAGAQIQLHEFNLSGIDDMREDILQLAFSAGAFNIGINSPEPYNLHQKDIGTGANKTYAVQYSQEGLGLKTYQSDLFNNWISTDWIDGPGGINEISAVSTAGDTFTIDALNLAQKVYNMLNRVAISGGSYDDWLDAVYTHERSKTIESPVYHGSLIKELGFEEVISNSETSINGDDQPLGTLAGRGKLTNKNKGGKIIIKVDEPCYIIGIVSITPRIDFSQGNTWDMNLETINDFHKPALDAIGYQDLITDQICWTDTATASATGVTTYKSAGKQPAWINYMTNVNKVYGNFAEENKDMFMVLNRRYDKNPVTGAINDMTTYIDPTKFNHIFAHTELDAQNFWVQISNNITARRKMSAKVIPNL